jgi:hypothetical protein
LRALRARARTEGHELPPDPTLRVTLSGWENGRHRPGPLYRRLLAEALETTEADLGFAARTATRTPPLLPYSRTWRLFSLSTSKPIAPLALTI